MKIFKEETIGELQTRFKNMYPFLNLEFYNREHALFSGSKAKDQLGHDVRFSDINPNMIDVNIPIEDDMSVTQLETLFEDSCQLHMQVFRKSGEVWLQTSSTDHWTLAEHSEHASEAEKFYHEKRKS